MKRQSKDELAEMFEELGELEEVRALTRKRSSPMIFPVLNRGQGVSSQHLIISHRGSKMFW